MIGPVNIRVGDPCCNGHICKVKFRYGSDIKLGCDLNPLVIPEEFGGLNVIHYRASPPIPVPTVQRNSVITPSKEIYMEFSSSIPCCICWAVECQMMRLWIATLAGGTYPLISICPICEHRQVDRSLHYIFCIKELIRELTNADIARYIMQRILDISE